MGRTLGGRSGRREHGARDVARRVGAREPRGRRGHRRAGAAVVEQDRVDRGAQALRASARRRRITIAAPPCSIQRALAVWWSAVACGYGTSTAGRPYWASSKIEPPARATARSAAASAWPNGVEVVAQVVVARPVRRAQVGEVAARRRRASTRYGASANAATAALVDRARAERAAEHEHAALVAARCRARARAAARSPSRGGTGRPVTR